MLMRRSFVCSIVSNWCPDQLVELERQRDAVIEDDASRRAERMIQHLARLRGIGM
jgi:hypothetical protein